MPFGLTNAPTVFQTLFKDILRDRFVFVYLDGIFIFNENFKEHTLHVYQVL